MNLIAAPEKLKAYFQIPGDILSAQPYGNGHINDTFCVTASQGGSPLRYIVQRINHRIFKSPPELMSNIQRVTSHLSGKLRDSKDTSRTVLTIIPATDGKAWARDESGDYWRCYIFVENARTYDVVETPEHAYEAAKAFGQFQKLLADLPAPRLHETIPDFHNTPKRFARFEKVAVEDARNRAALAAKEIEFAIAHRHIAGLLTKASLPERITHNDTKLNNVLLDDQTGRAVCVIDLDTVMPGCLLNDVGDLVRTSVSPAREDERQLDLVRVRMEMYEPILRGYLETVGDVLAPAERVHLPFAGTVITYENGIRFLTDYLEGDVYFKTHREGHNLDRCRTQFKLVEALQQVDDRVTKLIH